MAFKQNLLATEKASLTSSNKVLGRSGKLKDSLSEIL